MTDLLPITAIILVAFWLLAMVGAGTLARARQAECSELGLSSSAFVRAYRIRATLNIVACLIVFAVCITAAPMLDVDPLVGLLVGGALCVPVAYLALAVANKLVWRGWNDRYESVRQLAHQRRGAAR